MGYSAAPAEPVGGTAGPEMKQLFLIWVWHRGAMFIAHLCVGCFTVLARCEAKSR